MSSHTYTDSHTHQSTPDNRDTLGIFNLLPGGEPSGHTGRKYSIGLHPWHILGVDLFSAIRQVEEKARNHADIVAIGETGIDHSIKTPLDLQRKVFCHQVRIAENLRKPVIVHCVKAEEDLFRLRSGCKCQMPWVYHGFGSSPQMAKQMNSRHIYISLGSKVLKDIPKTNKLIRELDINFLLVETDESDTGIKEIYRYVARRRGISIEELIRIVHRNFQQVFKA